MVARVYDIYIMGIFDMFDKSDDEVNLERIEAISGLTYYNDFITKEEEKYLLDYLSNIEYTNEFSRATKYYGYNYSHKKRYGDINDFIGGIPKTLNIVFNKLGIDYNQLVVEKLPTNTQYSFPVQSRIFETNIMSISIGGNCVANFENKLTDEKSSVLVNRRSLMVFGGECRKEWEYRVTNSKLHKFNEKKFRRGDRYILTFKNIKFLNKADDDETFYFSY